MLPYSETRREKAPYPQYGKWFVIYKGSRARNEEQWDSEDEKVHLSMFLLDIDEDKEKYERRLIIEFIPSVESRTCDVAFFNSKSEADFNAVLNSITFKKFPLIQQLLLKSRACSDSVFGANILSNNYCK